MLAFPANVAMAQSTSAVRGTIADQQGGVLPNATVTLTSKDTGQTRSQKTTPSGNFAFDLIPPGHYMLIIDASGFKKTEVPVEALIARPSDLGVIKLTIGAAGESITVSAENQAVQVNTQDSSLGANFISEQISQLPVEARNVLSLLTLQAGVTSSGEVAGARSDQSNITLDGVNINDARTNSITGPVLRLNGEAIEEFRVSTMTSSATSARSAGAQVNLVTKSGTNQWRGSLFEFHRNTIFTANNWFNNHATPQQPRQTLLRNTFGGSLGGPVKKDKLFFFYSYEGRRDASSAIIGAARTVPLPSLAAGNVKFINNLGATAMLTPADLAAIFPDTNGENPAAIKALTKGASYGANSTTVGDRLNTGGFLFNAPARVHLNSHVARLDYNLTQKQTVYVRGNVIHDHDGSATQQYFPDTKAPILWSHPSGIAAAHTWTISNNLISNFKYGLTRQSFSQQGDTDQNYNYLRLVFVQTAGSRSISRTVPVHNFVEDLSWIKGNHTFGFGGSVYLVNSGSVNLGSAFDTAYANPSGYKTNLIFSSVNNYLQQKYGYTVAGSSKSSLENAVTALIGRYNNYTANFTFDQTGKLLAAGAPKVRNFKTQGYEGYFQDTWKMKSTFTLTGGLRYSLWRPVYETHGFEAQPSISLSDIFNKRVAGMLAGQPYTQLITVNKSGPVNGGPPMYSWDKTVFLPKVAVAWQPRAESGFLGSLLGKNGQSVIRGGFAMMNDYFGEQIATFFDDRNTLGFASAQVIPVNTFNLGCGQYVQAGFYTPSGKVCVSNPGPQFTDFGQAVRTLPLITPQTTLTFPQQKPVKAYPTAIESSLDASLVTPKDYAWSLTYEREMPKGGLLQMSYLGRMGRHLLAQRDIAQPANLVDPKSGMNFYTAATILEKARQANAPANAFNNSPIPYFENLFPSDASPGCNATCAWYNDALINTNDWTTTMLDFEADSITGNHAFYQPQYGALVAWSTIANSNYHGLAVSYRERMKDVTLDFNYTYSHSLDDASGTQTQGSYSGSSLILNGFQQRDNYTASDFDIRHTINVSSVLQIPVGRGKSFLSGIGGVADAIIGGWQLSNIFRYNTGIPLGAPYDAQTWATNWEVQSYVTPNKAAVPVDGCSTRLVATPKFFGNCLASAFAGFRNSYPGDTGGRNYLRAPHYINMDFGLGKTWKMPWKEGHQLQFRWETFNITNTQNFKDVNYSRAGWGIAANSGGPPTITPEFSNWTTIQGSPRVMQFGLRYSF
jgi:hypothetical protein